VKNKKELEKQEREERTNGNPSSLAHTPTCCAIKAQSHAHETSARPATAIDALLVYLGSNQWTPCCFWSGYSTSQSLYEFHNALATGVSSKR